MTTANATTDTAAAVAAWASRTLGTAAPADRHAEHAEHYNPATVPADVYARSIAWLARRYVRDMTSAAPAPAPKAPKAPPAARADGTPVMIDEKAAAARKAAAKDAQTIRTGGNDHKGLTYAELVARSHDAAADYYHGAIVRLSTQTIKRGETIARTGWQRANVGAHDHARAAIVIAQQARRARWRTAETETGGGRTTGRRRFPFIHGMSATGDNPAAIAALAESYARTGRTGTGHHTGRGRRPTIAAPAPDTTYRDAMADAVEAIMGWTQAENTAAPKTPHATAGGLAKIENHTMTRNIDGTTAIVDVDHIGPDTMPVLQNGQWRRVQTGWTAYTTTRSIPRHRFTMATASSTNDHYQPSTVHDIDHVGEIVAACTTWNPTHFPAAPAPIQSRGPWYTVEGITVVQTHRPAPAPRPATPDTIAGYREIMTYQSSLPRSPYKDWNPHDVTRIAEAFRRSMHDQAARAWTQTIGTQAAQWWYDAASR
jgi:hypothetical protein